MSEESSNHVLDESVEHFLGRRAAMLRWWAVIGGVSVVAVVGCWATLFLCQPPMVGPWHMAVRLRTRLLPAQALGLPAITGALWTSLCGLLLLALIFYVFVPVANGRRYFALVARLRLAATRSDDCRLGRRLLVSSRRDPRCAERPLYDGTPQTMD